MLTVLYTKPYQATLYQDFKILVKLSEQDFFDFKEELQKDKSIGLKNSTQKNTTESLHKNKQNNLSKDSNKNEKQDSKKNEQQESQKEQYLTNDQNFTITTAPSNSYFLLDKVIRFSLRKQIDMQKVPSMLIELTIAGLLPIEKSLELRKIILPVIDLKEDPLKDVNYFLIEDYLGPNCN